MALDVAAALPRVVLELAANGVERVADRHVDVLVGMMLFGFAVRDEFAAGSMLPKVLAACNFARESGNAAAIGALVDIEAMLAGRAGTRITTETNGVEYAGGTN